MLNEFWHETHKPIVLSAQQFSTPFDIREWRGEEKEEEAEKNTPNRIDDELKENI